MGGVSQVQAHVATSTTTAAPAWSPATLANDLGLFCVVNNRSSAATTSTLPTGYTSVGLATNDFANGIQHVGIWPCYKAALAASESNPTSTVPTDLGNVSFLQEWAGIAVVAALDAVGTVQQTAGTSGNQTPSVVTTQPGDLVWTVVAGHSGGLPTCTFGGGSVADVAVALFNSNIFYASAFQIAGAAGTISPTVSVSGITGTGLPLILSVSMAFRAAQSLVYDERRVRRNSLLRR